ncbi:T9SS type A sorting domain-containing protein [Pedobacter sp.]
MKKKITLIIATCFIAQIALAQNFTKGNLVIARLGNGVNTLNSGALPVSLIEVDPTTKVVTNTVNIPSTTAGQRLLINGNPAAGANEGGISLSADGRYIVIGGADVVLFDNNTGPDNKSFARINGIGNVELFTINGTINNGFIRATTSIDGNGIWLTSNDRIGYVAWGATGASLFSNTGSRYVQIVGNQLYSVSGTNPATVLNFGIPQTTTTTNNGTALTGTSSSTVQSAYGFALLDLDNTITNAIDGNDVLYIVDQTAASPGIIKMAYNSASNNWDYIGKYSSSVPFYGLTGRKTNSGQVELFTVSNFGENNQVVSVVDANSRTTFNSGSITQTTLASAGTNYVFRSVAFSPFDAVLPLDLLSFQASAKGNNATIRWQTKNELNLDEFIIERSTDQNRFETIKTVKAKNTAVENNYQIQDDNLPSSNYYYRLKITDLDGNKTYSDIKAISAKGLISFNLFPNPAQDVINLELPISEKSQIAYIYSSEGKLTKQIKLQATSSKQQLDISTLKPGAYMIKIDHISQMFIKK